MDALEPEIIEILGNLDLPGSIFDVYNKIMEHPNVSPRFNSLVSSRHPLFRITRSLPI